MLKEFSKPNSKDCKGILHNFSCLLQSHRHTSVSSHIKYYLFNSSGTSFITGMGSFAIEGSFLDMIAFSKGRTEGTATGFTGGGWGCGTSACGGPGEGTCRGDSLPGSGVTLIIPTSISLRNRSSTALFSIMVFGVCGGMTSSVIINSFDQ